MARRVQFYFVSFFEMCKNAEMCGPVSIGPILALVWAPVAPGGLFGVTVHTGSGGKRRRENENERARVQNFRYRGGLGRPVRAHGPSVLKTGPNQGCSLGRTCGHFHIHME